MVEDAIQNTQKMSRSETLYKHEHFSTSAGIPPQLSNRRILWKEVLLLTRSC